MSKTKKSYAETISLTQEMISGLKLHQEAVAKRGLTEEFILELDKARQEAVALNDEQAKVKAQLKAKTEALNSKMDDIYKKLGEAKKVVKLAMPQSQWISCGIKDKR
ncbi:hypothetical protein [Capnocytophaga sp.]|uniref:hypothetical protein n=1 Tax=Capnocytophaga sp. TaxID=44737 RepID=UPI0026DBACD7|nr:hypothetical protein [Capnocytophaga sp.]MDO5105575.1 hypothetical protein [Capnocytophaga sp.]